MRPGKLRGLERRFRDFLEDVSLKCGYEKTNLHMGRVYGPRSAMLQWEEGPFSAVITATQELCPTISDRQIARALRNLMVEMFESQAVSEDGIADRELESITEVLDTSCVGEEISQMVSSLNELARTHVVFVPIEGLALTVNSLEIGDVKFYPRTSASELDQTLLDIEERAKRVDHLETDLRDATCYARVEVVGDDYFARNEAVRRAKEAIHILNLYLSSPRHQFHHWASIRVARVIINRTLEDDQISYNQSFPFERPLELDSVRKQNMLQAALEELSDCFQPQSNSDIAKRGRQAVTWYSKAVDADSPEEKFVNLAIALESLLIGREGGGPYATTGSISQRIGERVAFLLADSFESRVNYERKAKELYGLRSAIVHSGESVAETDLALMDELAIQVIIGFFKHGFKSWPEFRKWIAHERYDGPTS